MSSKILSDSESHMDQSLSSPGITPSSSTDRKVSEDFTGKYPYEPLPSGRYIRLLRLEPPASSSTQNIPVISATLREVNLFAVGESPCPPYKALSYEWGLPPSNPSDTPTMLLDNHPIHIRQNLYDALHSILHNHKELYGESPLYLWVDALCINQLDDREKGHQVQLMKNIYKGAELVIVWLGMGTACTDEAMESLKMEWKDLLKYIAEGNLGRKERQGITDLYCNATYWRRVWILQEFALARDYVVLCNRAFITKRCFESGLEIARYWSVTRLYGAGLGNGAFITKKCFSSELETARYWLMTTLHDKLVTGAHTNWPAPDLIHRAPAQEMIALRSWLSRPSGPTLDDWVDTVCSHGFKATDPRDYVFAILGISRDGDKIVPDYELSTSEVYSMFVSKMDLPDERFHQYLAYLMGLPHDLAWELQQELEAEEEDMSNLGDQDK